MFVCVMCIFLQGHAVHSSYVQSGTLLEASHLPAYSVTEQHESDTTSVTRTTRSLMTGLRQHYTDTASQQSSADSITVAMYSVSLVGSWDDNDDIADSVELGPDVDVDKFIIDRLLATAQTVVDSGARVLACQKVNNFLHLFSFDLDLLLYSNTLYHAVCFFNNLLMKQLNLSAMPTEVTTLCCFVN